jgi:DNA processing protein
MLSGARLPPRVRDLADPPEELHLRGALPGGPAVAIVGTREPTYDGELYARHLAGVLAAEGVAILSGGAKGVDTAAHRGALDVGGITLVVAPSGFLHPYPRANGELFREIVARGGGYVSLVPDDAGLLPGAFFPRNALLVALCHALIVVEAPCRSGARNAARHARELGRPVFAVPHAPWNPRGLAAAVEIELGARPLVSTKTVLRLLVAQGLHPIRLARAPAPAPPPAPPPAPAPASAPARGPAGAEPVRELPADLDPAARSVAEAVRAGCSHPDEIAAQTGLPVPDVQRALLTLDLRGVLDAGPHYSESIVTR